MAGLIFAQAKSINKQCKAFISLKREAWSKDENDSGFDEEYAREQFIESKRDEFRKILHIAKLLHDDYREICMTDIHNSFFVTIRPKPEVEFNEFYAYVYKWANRAFMKSFKLSFEQKSIDGDGHGFHVHAVIKTKHRSQGECLRDTKSTFNKICNDNCIEIKTTRNPDELFNRYCIEYESNDGHKDGTKIGDDIWRTKMGLRSYYEDVLPKVVSPPLLIKSGTEGGVGTILKF